MDSSESRILWSAVFFLVGMIGCIASIKTSVNPVVVALGNSFAAGILLGAGLVHLAPDARELLEDTSEKLNGYPISYLLTAAGFLLVLLMEETAIYFYTCNTSDHKNALLGHSHGPLTSYTSVGEKSEDNVSHGHGHGDCHHHHEHHEQTAKISRDLSNAFRGEPDKHTKILSSCVLLLALSSHSLIEGMGFGQNVGLPMAIAICSHKGFAGFALTGSLQKMNLNHSRPCVLYGMIVFFCVMTPIGIMIGWALSSETEGKSLTSGVLLALAAGTFLYVSTVELLSHEFCNDVNTNKPLKAAFLVVGFGAMSALAIWV